MGKILRIGTDTTTNYTFLKTSAYDANNPAATTTTWPDSTSMDVDFVIPNPTTVSAEGVLVTFTRLPDTFLGAMVKIKPTYDTSIGEAPAFEMWTHSVAGGWVRRRHIDLTNVFVGVPTGTFKVLDLTFFPFLRDVNQVWLTMAPGTTGAPSMAFAAIQLYGQCDGALRDDHGRGPAGACSDPTDPFYTGFDDEGNPCPGTTFGPPAVADPPALNVCNAASIENYRAYARTIPGYLEVFDAWVADNATTISAFCAGNGPSPGSPPRPPGSPPALPPLDLCSQDSIDAFRAALAGDPDQVTAFNDYIDSLTQSGFFDLTCAPPEPAETPIDPETGKPKETEPNPPTPFGTGPGGQPQFPRPGDTRGPTRGSPTDYATTINRYVFMFFSVDEQAQFESALNSIESSEIQTAWADPAKQVFIFGNNVGPNAAGDYVHGLGYTQQALDRVVFTIRGVNNDDIVEVLALSATSHFLALQQYTPPNIKAWNGTKANATVNSSVLVDWLVERGARLDGIPGTPVEQGGDPGAVVAQRKGIVVNGASTSSAVQLTLVAAYDPTAHTIITGTPSQSDEAVHGDFHKHLEAGIDPDPPGTNPTLTCTHPILYFKISVNKKISALLSNGGFNSVSVGVSFTTVTS